MRRRIIHWLEDDVHTRWRQVMLRNRSQRDLIRYVKRMSNRRERREGKRETREDR